jgi:Flp pilus assembly protein CpaB
VTALTALVGRTSAIRLPKIDARLVVGLLLVALSVIGGLRLAASSDETVAVYTAARDLPADHVLVAGDLRVTRINADDEVLAGLISATGGNPPLHRVLKSSVSKSGLVATAVLGGVESTGREITVPISSDHALGGALEMGDRVDVLASFDKGTELAKTLTVASGARVAAVVHADGLFGQREGELTALTLSVAPDDVVFLAFAVRNGEVDVVRANGTARRARSQFDVSQLP